MTALPFTLVHGLFLALILFLFLPKEFGPSAGVSLPALKLGLIGVLIFLLLGLTIDLVQLKDKSFRWIELLTQRALGRIFVVPLDTQVLSYSSVGIGIFCGPISNQSTISFIPQSPKK